MISVGQLLIGHRQRTQALKYLDPVTLTITGKEKYNLTTTELYKLQTTWYYEIYF